MAKQKYEITAFTKGIIGSPSETDIPEEAASYSINIDPNAEDGVLRAIKTDTLLNNDGFKAGQEKMVEELEVKVIVNGHRYNII